MTQQTGRLGHNSVSFTPTELSPPEVFILRKLKNLREQTGGAFGMSFPEGKELDCAVNLAERGLAENVCGYFGITDAGLAALPNEEARP